MSSKKSSTTSIAAMNASIAIETPNITDSGKSPLMSSSPQNRRNRIVGLCVASTLSIGAIFAAAKYHRESGSEPGRDPRILVAASAIGFQPGAPHWNQVKIERVESAKQRWSDPAPAHIRVDETRTSRVGAPLPGRVGKVFATIGQPVKKGALLFSVMSPDLATLQSDRMKAEVDLRTAKLAYERVHAIVQAQALPAKDETIAAQQMAEAELSSRAAAERLASLKVQTISDNEYVVKSPRDGVVVENHILPDQEISNDPSSTSMVVADTSNVWVVADLFESDTSGVKAGINAKVLLDTSVIESQVDNVAAASDPEQHTIAVRVVLPNKDGTLRPNTFARVQFEALGDNNAVEVGSTALVSDGSTQYVYVQRSDGLFEKRNVIVGPVREGRALILSGLSVGEAVAARGAVLIDNQMAIYQ
jgi:RND family efflux transporter MFP subunit